MAADGGVPASPYKGLVPYTEEDREFFFGRDRERTLIVGNLLASPLTLLYGDSGVGKTSVLRAAVAPQLRRIAVTRLARRQAPGAGDGRASPGLVVVVYNEWRSDPTRGLVAAAHTEVERALSGEGEVPMPPPDVPLDEALERLGERLGGEVLVILDQFEEYFLYHGNDPHEPFADGFARAASRIASRTSFLVSIREDALAKLDRFKGRIPGLFERYLRIDHLDRASAEQAILKPLERYNELARDRSPAVEIEPSLVDEVLEQVRRGRVSLDASLDAAGPGPGPDADFRVEAPYLQLVLERLWATEMANSSSVLRSGTLVSLGGAERIVRRHLDDVMDDLPATHRDVAARIFRFLVTPGGTKIALGIADLAALGEVGREEVEAVLIALARPGILILRRIEPRDAPGEDASYEIYHDVMAAAILDWRARYVRQQEREEQERRFREATRKADEELEKARRLAAAERRSKRLAMGFVVVLIPLLVAAVVGFVAAVQQRNVAKQQRDRAVSAVLAADALRTLATDPELSILLSVEAVRVAPTDEAVAALRQSLMASRLRAALRRPGRLNDGAFSPDGRAVVVAGEQGQAEVWPWADRGKPRTLQGSEAVETAVFSPDSRIVAAVTGPGGTVVRLWEWEESRPPVDLRLEGHVNSVSFSADGRFLVTGDDAGATSVWDLRDVEADAPRAAPVDVLEAPRGPDGLSRVLGAAFVADGHVVLSAPAFGAPVLWSWESAPGREPVRLAGPRGENDRAFFSPDGRLVLLTGDNEALLWSGARLGPPRRLPSAGPVTQAAFDLRNQCVATATATDSRVRVHDVGGRCRPREVRTGGSVRALDLGPGSEDLLVARADAGVVFEGERPVADLRGDQRALTAARFSPDGRYVLTVGMFGARIWEWRVQPAPVPLDLRPRRTVQRAAFAGGGRRVVTVHDDGSATLWNVATGGRLANLRAEVPLKEAAADPSVELVVGVEQRGGVAIFDAGSGRRVAARGEGPSGVEVASFGRDSDRILTVGGGTASIWDWRDSGRVLELPAKGVTNASFDPEGRFVVTARPGAIAEVWDAREGRLLARLTQGRPPAEGGDAAGETRSIKATFSPDGALVAMAGKGGSPTIWDWEEETVVAQLTGGPEPVGRLAFSPDGQLLLVVAGDATGIWDWRTDPRPKVLDGLQGQFEPGGRFVLTVVANVSPKVWEARTGRLVAEGGALPDAPISAASTGRTGFVVATRASLQPFRCDACRLLPDLLALAESRTTRRIRCEEVEPFVDDPRALGVDCEEPAS